MFDEDSNTHQQIRQLQKKLKKYPLLFARLGECYLRLGDWNRAELILKKGVSEHPEYTTGHLVLGGGYLYKGLYGDAEECVTRGLEQQPNHLGLLQLMKKIKRGQEKKEDIREIETTIRMLDPLHEAESAQRAEAEIEMSDEAEVSDSDQIPPASLWKMKAASKATQVETSAAASGGDELAGTVPDDRQSASDEVTSSQSGAEERPDQPSEMVESEEPTKSETEKPTALEAEGTDEAARSESDAGESEASSTEPDDEPEPAGKKIATRTLGELYATQNKFDEAIEIYEKLIANEPGNEPYKERLEELKSRRETALSTTREEEKG